MARFREHVIPWPDKRDDANYKDLRRGAAEDAFWDEDEPVYMPRKKGKKRPSAKKGCPGNDDGPHVYIWVKVTKRYLRWNGNGFFTMTYNEKTCCGCNKVTRRKYAGRD